MYMDSDGRAKVHIGTSYKDILPPYTVEGQQNGPGIVWSIS